MNATTNLIPRGLANQVVSRDVVHSFRQGLNDDRAFVSASVVIPQTVSDNVITNGFGGSDVSNDVFETVLEEANTDVATNVLAGLVSSGSFFARGVVPGEGSNTGNGEGLSSGLRLGGVNNLGTNGDGHSTIVNEVRFSEVPVSSVSLGLSLGQSSDAGGSRQLLPASFVTGSGARIDVSPIMGSDNRSRSAGVQRVNSLAELGVNSGLSASGLGGVVSGDVSHVNGVGISVGLSLGMSNGHMIPGEGSGMHADNVAGSSGTVRGRGRQEVGESSRVAGARRSRSAPFHYPGAG